MEADTESCIAQMEEAWKTRSTEMLMRLNKLKAQYRQLNHCDHPKVDRCNWADAQECLVCGEIIEYEKKHD